MQLIYDAVCLYNIICYMHCDTISHTIITISRFFVITCGLQIGWSVPLMANYIFLLSFPLFTIFSPHLCR